MRTTTKTSPKNMRPHFKMTAHNLGRATFKAYCDMRHLDRIERTYDYTFTDLIVDVLTFAERGKGWDADDILKSVQTHLNAERVESCPKCGARVTRENAFEDEGEGEEAGRTFYYCSERCRETH